MKKVWIWMISIFAFLVILVFAWIIYRNIFIADYSVDKLIRVIDGDTFELFSNDTIIRLLCVNTPEEDEEGYEEAKTFLEDLLYSNVFHMEYSNYGNYTDAYGRLLMWVYIEDESGEQILINKLIIEEGYGELMIIPPETCKEITEIIAN
jgi:endonuclease YncB( thermonuclease family)